MTMCEGFDAAVLDALANGGPGASAWIGCSHLQGCRVHGGDPLPGLARDGICSVQTGTRREDSTD